MNHLHFESQAAKVFPQVDNVFPLGLDNRSQKSGGQLHLSLRLGGKRICYAYIRKNGCSSFKAALGYAPDTRISEIARSHKARWYHHHDATIFVWRDPLERVVSLYRNKILDGRGAEDLVARYLAVMGEAPSSFSRFLEFASLGGDPHCLPQAHHLRPIVYTHAIPLYGLHDAMHHLVGPNAARPFLHRFNRSRPTQVEVTEADRKFIRQIYAADYEMLNRIG